MTDRKSFSMPKAAFLTFAIILSILLAVGGCQQQGQEQTQSKSPSPSPAPTKTPSPAQAPSNTAAVPDQKAGVPESGQKTFASPEEAAAAFKQAVAEKDTQQLIDIFGPKGEELVLSGDPVQDNNNLTEFAAALAVRLRVDTTTPDKAVLYVGRKNWPFPIPVVKSGNVWFFDTAAGSEELINRRVGENELGAIQTSRTYVAAQKEYARKDRTGENVTQYAQKLASTKGKKDGLYWSVKDGEELSPLGPFAAEAREEGYTRSGVGRPAPYHGYYFKILTSQGKSAPGGAKDYIVDGHMTKGFALVAYPAEWGNSGVMTFIVNQDGKVYQKNLGEKTGELASQIKTYDPDSTWEEVKD